MMIIYENKAHPATGNNEGCFIANDATTERSKIEPRTVKCHQRMAALMTGEATI